MMMAPPPPSAPTVSGPLTVLDPTGQFAKRKKTSLWFTVALLVVSVFILTIGLAATTRTENVTVGGYYPGIVLGFGSFLGIVGIHLVENRRQMEPRPLYNKRCQFYSSGIGFLYDAYQTEVTCYNLNSKCQLKVKSNTCYCCDLYNCENSEQSSSYYEFLGVSGCQDVVHLYRLLWSSTVLNIIGLFLGIITAAILGAFKDMVPLSQIAFSAAPPPQILYNPAQQILTYAGFCPSAATISTYPSYPLPLQVLYKMALFLLHQKSTSCYSVQTLQWWMAPGGLKRGKEVGSQRTDSSLGRISLGLVLRSGLRSQAFSGCPLVCLMTRNPNVGSELCYSSHEREHSPHGGQEKAVTQASGKPKEASDTDRIWQKSLHTVAYLTLNMEISRFHQMERRQERGGNKRSVKLSDMERVVDGY
ncbi:transmembrane protein 255B isoform 2-T2 [Alca torda]